MDQKECFNVKFSEGLGIFDDHHGYRVIDGQKKYNGLTGKVKNIQGFLRQIRRAISSSPIEKQSILILMIGSIL